MSTETSASPAAVTQSKVGNTNTDVAAEAVKHPVSSQAVQSQIASLVARLQAALEAQPNICRKLCRLALDHQMSAELFRRRLVQAGLAFSRASELKIVYAARAECARFLAPVSPQSWRTTLTNARKANCRGKLGRTDDREAQLALAAAPIAGLLHRLLVLKCPVEGGMLTLVPKDSSRHLDNLVAAET